MINVIAGIQTAKGTPQTTDVKSLQFTDFSVKPEVNKIESKVLSSGRWTKDTMPGRKSVSGDFGLEPNIAELEMVLQCAGFVKQSDTYKSGLFDKYMTLIQNTEEQNLNLQYNDCLVNTITITASQEAFLSTKVGVIGMESKVNETKFSGSAPLTEGEQLVCYGAVLKDSNNDISANVESVEITINNSLEGRGGLNTRSFTKILQNGRGSVDVTIQYNSFERENYLKANKMLTDNSSIELLLILKEDISTEAGTKGRIMEIKLPKVKLTNVEIGDLEGAGTITRTMSALPDEHGNPIEFKIVEKPEL